jgi:hypothetical protein
MKAPQFKTVIALAALLLIGCSKQNQVDPTMLTDMPQKIVWAWERPEDLRFLEPNEFGVAFLAQTLLLERDSVMQKPRRQPLEVSPGTYIIAVTRIETNKEDGKRASFDEAMVQRTATLINNSLDLPDVRAIQIDFDAAVSERAFYRELMLELKNRLEIPDLKDRFPNGVPLTMTSLASWCTGDAWFNDFPVAEAVPMVFQMGADTEKIKTYLRNGNDWNEPLCRGSYGISLDENLGVMLKSERRLYFFKSGPWSISDFERLENRP